MSAYYNEIDPYAAAWLRNLIAAGHIASGDVDERDIRDVHPDDLRPYAQCHFFAGIGIWSYALRRAGWADDREVWTGSCPCQPFSAAGAGAGFTDERHLWPHFFHLIQERRPAAVFGEQVASKDADPWIDLVQDDLEALGYAVGALAFPSAGVGAPHIRDRLFWVGHADHEGLEGLAGHDGAARREGPRRPVAEASVSGWMADDIMQQRQDWQPGLGAEHETTGRLEGSAAVAGLRGDLRAGPTDDFWRDADWLFCRDGKWRAVEPGTFPLAHGTPARVGRLRAYGNAINAEATRVWIEAVMECLPD